MLVSLMMLVHQQMFRNIKTLQKWKLSTGGAEGRMGAGAGEGGAEPAKQ